MNRMQLLVCYWQLKLELLHTDSGERLYHFEPLKYIGLTSPLDGPNHQLPCWPWWILDSFLSRAGFSLLLHLGIWSRNKLSLLLLTILPLFSNFALGFLLLKKSGHMQQLKNCLFLCHSNWVILFLRVFVQCNSSLWRFHSVLFLCWPSLDKGILTTSPHVSTYCERCEVTASNSFSY